MQMYFMYLRILRMCNGRYSSVIRSCFRKHLMCIIWFALVFFFKPPPPPPFKLFQVDRTVQCLITDR